LKSRAADRTIAANRSQVTTVIPADGDILDRILESTCATWHQGLDRQAYRKLDTARMKTAWGARRQRRYALVEGRDLLASAKQYDLTGVLDRRPVRICGIGSVFTEQAHRGAGHAGELVEHLLDDAARDGAELALLFSAGGEARNGFEVVPTTEVELTVAESPRHGAPMTMVRNGEERDLAAVAAMGQSRAEGFRFHLDRDVDFVQYAITSKRLLGGLGPPGARQLHFFIAEEGITAAAYIVVSVVGSSWTIEECGDRDPSGARVGALLQALIAREPVERRPSIRAWLPRGFAPPQVTIAAARPAAEVMMVRALGSTGIRPPLSAGDTLYWLNDLF
jgi:GNAT superfamily N-acetyltransferase